MSNVAKYFDDVAQSMMSHYSRFETLIPNTTVSKKTGEPHGGSNHNAEDGRFLESVIRAFLNKHLPSNLRALSGFILRPVANVDQSDTRRRRDQGEDKHSSQLDIIIFDVGNYPVFESYEDFAIVPPEGVYAIISVKKRLKLGHIEPELKALSYAASLCNNYNKNKAEKVKGFPPNQRVAGPITALIGFKTDFVIDEDAINKVFEKVKTTQESYPVDGVIKLISSIEQFSFFRTDHRYNKSSGTYRVPFVWIKHKLEEEKKARMNLTLQYLLHFTLRLYYDSTRQPLLIKPGFNEFEESTRKDKRFNGQLTLDEERFTKVLDS